MAELNETIHQPVRLRIMASLVTLAPGDEVDFTYLRGLLDVTATLTVLDNELTRFAPS